MKINNKRWIIWLFVLMISVNQIYPCGTPSDPCGENWADFAYSDGSADITKVPPGKLKIEEAIKYNRYKELTVEQLKYGNNLEKIDNLLELDIKTALTAIKQKHNVNINLGSLDSNKIGVKINGNTLYSSFDNKDKDYVHIDKISQTTTVEIDKEGNIRLLGEKELPEGEYTAVYSETTEITTKDNAKGSLQGEFRVEEGRIIIPSSKEIGGGKSVTVNGMTFTRLQDKVEIIFEKDFKIPNIEDGANRNKVFVLPGDVFYCNIDNGEVTVDGMMVGNEKETIKFLNGGVVSIVRPLDFDTGKLLKEGDSGEDVKTLQYKLNYYLNEIDGSSITVTGSFDRDTVEALKKVQSKIKTKPDGIFGPDTNKKMVEVEFFKGKGEVQLVKSGIKYMDERTYEMGSKAGPKEITETKETYFRIITHNENNVDRLIEEVFNYNQEKNNPKIKIKEDIKNQDVFNYIFFKCNENWDCANVEAKKFGLKDIHVLVAEGNRYKDVSDLDNLEDITEDQKVTGTIINKYNTFSKEQTQDSPLKVQDRVITWSEDPKETGEGLYTGYIKVIRTKKVGEGKYVEFTRVLNTDPGYPLEDAKITQDNFNEVERNLEKNPWIEGLIEDECSKKDADPTLVKAVVSAESFIDPNAKPHNPNKEEPPEKQNPDDISYGPGQITPKAIRDLNSRGGDWDMEKVKTDSSVNLKATVEYIVWLGERYNWNVQLVAAAYNVGTGAVDKNKGIPNYTTTKDYVKRVLAYYFYFKKRDTTQ